MAVANTRTRYGTVAMSLHWLIAALVITNICLGLYFADLPHSDPNKFILVQTHKSIGLTVLLLSIARLVWRLMNPVPPLPRGMNTIGAAVGLSASISRYSLFVVAPSAMKMYLRDFAGAIST